MKERPVATKITLSSGNTYRVLFSALGMIRATEEYDYFGASQIETDPDKLPKSRKARGFIHTATETVWIGVLTYELISFEDFAVQIRTTEDFEELGKCYGYMRRYQMRKPSKEELEEQDREEEQDDAKKPEPSASPQTN